MLSLVGKLDYGELGKYLLVLRIFAYSAVQAFHRSFLF